MRAKSFLAYLCPLAVVLAMGCAQGMSDDTPAGDDEFTDECGDDTCGGTESATSCPADCGVQNACGDGVCNGSENVNTCARDCATCGDGQCQGSENATTCASDCQSGPVCGDGACAGGETATSCPQDCTGGGGTCGDLTCTPPETAATCPTDCGGGTAGCGDFVCDVAGGECTSCLFPDCFFDTACGGGGGGTCDHDVCTAGTPLDSSCGACEAAICTADDWCCTVDYDQACIDLVATECPGTTCP
jgi:hypothetical protein